MKQRTRRRIDDTTFSPLQRVESRGIGAIAIVFMVVLAGCDYGTRAPAAPEPVPAPAVPASPLAPEHPTTSLLDAVSTGNVQQVKAHLYWCRKQGGCDVNARTSGYAPPLLEAARKGYPDIVKLLLDAGAVVNLTDRNGMTSLHWIGVGGHATVAKLLLAAGADVNARDNDGGTPLSWDAGLSGDLGVARLLLDAGAAISTSDKLGLTPLHHAASGDSAGVAKLLLVAGARVDSRDSSGKTPLHHAAGMGAASVAQALIEGGADVNARDNDGETPLTEATAKIDLSTARAEELELGVSADNLAEAARKISSGRLTVAAALRDHGGTE